ncbi:MAG: hypothetical protein OEV21_00280 [Thermoplasmata archaeon]|nr:hypothetical protein [Thermoplasmata archaeon]
MRLSEMKAKCRKCGKELKADSKDDDFVSFYCINCGIYTNRPVEEFKEEEKPPEPPQKPEEDKS